MSRSGVREHIRGVSKHTWGVSNTSGVSLSLFGMSLSTSGWLHPLSPCQVSRDAFPGRESREWGGPEPATLPHPPSRSPSHQGQRDSARWDGASDFHALVLLGRLGLAGVP